MEAQPTDRRMTGGRAVVEWLRLAPLGHPAKSLLRYQSWARPPVGSDVRGRRDLAKSSVESSKARCEHSSPSDSGGKAYPGCAATQGEVLRAQRRVLGESAARIWVGVGGECPAWQRSALASCGDAVLGKAEASRILDHGVRSCRRWRLHRGLKGRMSSSVGGARGTTVLAG